MPLVAFSGRKHSGKSELAKICAKKNYKIINFADSLKDMVCICLGISREYLEEYKDTILPGKYDLTNNINYISKEIGLPEFIVRKYLSKPFNSIRRILQVIGTNLIRNYNHEWHINKIKDKILSNHNINYCIGDLRFMDEKEMIEKLGGECWFIIRPSVFEISNHISEINLKWTDFGNNIIINNENKECFKQTWKNYLDGTQSYKKLCEKNLKPTYLLIKKLGQDFMGFLEATTESSYIMGLLTSSGGIKKTDTSAVLYLSNKDKEIVDIYKKFIESDKSIIHTNGKYYLECDNSFIIENIKLWNLKPDKSMCEIPHLIRGNLKMLKYWILGLIDGECNTVSSLMGTSTHPIIIASKNIIDYLMSIFPYEQNLPKIVSNENLFELQLSDDNYRWLKDD